MGVEAARAALARRPGLAPAAVYFATADPAYLDKTNATAIHAALGLDDSPWPSTCSGSIRSAAGALRAALDAGRPTLAVLSDVRTGLPGGADEREGGDAAVAFLLPAPTLAARCSRSRSRRPRPPASSSTAGGCRATPPRASGRSASASTRTCPLARGRRHRRAQAGRRHRADAVDR